jgi:phosphatidate cytidylyltransferase
MPDVSSSPSAADAFKAANLRQRVITAVVIGAAFLALVLLSSPFWFALGSAVIFLVAAWEWSDLAGLKNRSAQVFYQVFLMSILLYCFTFDRPLRPDAMVIVIDSLSRTLLVLWGIALWLIVRYPATKRYLDNANVNVFAGLMLFMPTWLSLYFLKKLEPDGILVLVAIFVIALADVGAYFVGVRFGKHKLAPKVSPGKSWEGLAGGIFFNVLFAVAFSWSENISLQKGIVLALVMIMTAAASVIGDLFESMIKRHRGVKDSGTILPGHGGVLDRIDGWMPAIPLFTFACLHGWVKV